MVRGKRNFLRGTVLQISIGVDKNGRVFSGPRSAVAKHSVKYVSISHGSEKKSDIAKKIVQQLGARNIDDVMRSMPGGTFSLVSI